MEIKEPLAIAGGSLVGGASGWELRFSFPGPDQRYNHTLLSLGPSEVEELLASYPLAFQRYIRLKEELPRSTKVSEAFGANLTIRVSDFADGVCLASYRVPVRTEFELSSRLRTLREAAARGASLVVIARNLRR